MATRRHDWCGMLCLLGISAFSLASPARAETITFAFSGTISSVTETGATPVGGPYSVTVGETFSGTYTYNTNATPWYTSTNENLFTDPTASITATIGSTTFGAAFQSTYGTGSTSELVDYDLGSGSSYENYFNMSSGSSNVNFNTEIESSSNVGVNFLGNNSTPQGILPSSGLPTSLDPSDFNILDELNLSETVENFSTNAYLSDFQVVGDITSLNVIPNVVPEPSTFVMLGMGLAGVLGHARLGRRASRTIA